MLIKMLGVNALTADVMQTSFQQVLSIMFTVT